MNCFNACFNDEQRQVACNSNSTIRNPINSDLNEARLPLRGLKTRQGFVADCDVEETILTTNQELIELFEHKVQGVIARL